MSPRYANHRHIYGMVSEHTFRRVRATDRERSELSTILRLWLEGNGFQLGETFRSFDTGDANTVGYVTSKKYGQLMLKTQHVHSPPHGWEEHRLLQAIGAAMRESGVSTFTIPEPLVIERVGNLNVFLYRPLEGDPVSESDALPVDRRALLEELHSLIESPALVQLPQLPLLHNWDYIGKYLEELEGSGLTFKPAAVHQFAHDFLTAAPAFDSFPVVLIHGDFHAKNMFAQPDGKLGIIDWEFARRAHALTDDAALILERSACGLDVTEILRDVQERFAPYAEQIPIAMRVNIIKQLLKGLVYSRVRFPNPDVEANYLSALDRLMGWDTVLQNERPAMLSRVRVVTHPIGVDDERS